ncbi:MAG: S8 family serine peptidase, partial [Caldisericia bacterium]|nr:S8 family serine peptidase [Caldisericia bacterium]
MTKKWLGLFISIILFFSGSISPLSLLKAAPESMIVRIQISHPDMVETLFEQSFSLVEMYESFVLVKADYTQIQHLEALSIPYLIEEDTHLLKIGNHSFFAEPDKSISSRDSSLEAVKSAIHVVQWIGPEKIVWKETLESWGVTFLVPVYKNAWIIEVNSLFVPELRNFRFVQALQTLPNCTRQNLDFSLITSETIDLEIAFSSLEASKEWLNRKGLYLSAVMNEANPLTIVHLSEFPVIEVPSLFLEPGIITVTEKQKPVLLNAEASQVLNIRDTLDQNIIQGLEGEGEIVGFADTGLSTGDPSTVHPAFTMPTFADKVVAAYPPGGWRDYHGHGTHVAGSIVGTGAGDTVQANGIRYQGMAPKARVVAQSVWSSYGNNTMYQILSDAYSSGARIHSNSWSDSNDSWGQYDNSAYLIDQFHWDHMDFQGLFAAGNSRSYSQYGVWPPPNNGTYSLTNFSASKNGIGIGASQSLKSGYDPEVMAYFSSEGPTADERIKPEIVSPGNYIRSTRNTGGYTTMSGTSMATPVTAGSLVLVREHVRKNLHISPQIISSALLKALLLHGANASILKDHSS